MQDTINSFLTLKIAHQILIFKELCFKRTKMIVYVVKLNLSVFESGNSW